MNKKKREPAIRVLRKYLFVVLPHWWAIVAGFALATLDLVTAWGREISLPAWLKWTQVVLGLLVAQFRAYRDLVDASEEEASSLREEIAKLRITPYSEQHRQIADRKLGALDDSSRVLVIFLLHRGRTTIDSLRR